MDAMKAPDKSTNVVFYEDDMLSHVVKAALKLHALGGLSPYQEKLRQFAEHADSKAQKAQPNSRVTSLGPGSEPKPTDMCRALADLQQFAAKAIESLQWTREQLSREEWAAQAKQATIFMQLYPGEYIKLGDRIPRPLNDRFVISWGEQAPLQVLEAYQAGKINADMLRFGAEAAVVSGHPDGAAMFVEANKLLALTETTRSRASVSAVLQLPPDIAWYHAASRTSKALGRQAAWFLARDYLSGQYDFNMRGILPTQERSAEQLLAVAYCLQAEYPELARELVARNLPRALQNLEQGFEQPFRSDLDLSCIAWFDPQAAHDLMIKFNERLAEEKKKSAAAPAPGQAPGQPVQFTPEAQRLQTMAANLTLLRHSCLRGLLLDRL